MVEKKTTTWDDPIVAETRAVREAWEASFDSNLKAMAEQMKKNRAEWEMRGFKYIELPPKAATKLTGTRG